MNPTSAHVFDVDETNFEANVLQESMRRPVLVDFWASWCGPCRTLGPLLEELTEAYGGAVALAKVDLDQNAMIAQQFGVQSVPVVFALFQGRPVDHFGGVLPRPELKAFIDSVLQRCGVEAPALAEQAPEDPLAAEGHWRGVLAKRPDDG
ncbi:MAG: thioredoxin domain-containing protein, partial [Myxococcota bacterium]|nr:thioredoxin domain-containing protein [Myxococcota bacterium]